MKLIISIIFSLISANAFCCSFRGESSFEPTVVGTVKSVTTISGFHQRYAEAVILVIESKEEHFLIGNEYKFIVKGPNGGGTCQARVEVGVTYNFDFKYVPPEKRQENFKQWDGSISIMSLKPVNQALKAQPSAAGDAASGAP